MGNTLLSKITLKLKIEWNFLLIHRLGWKRPSADDVIPKYQLKKILPANPTIIDCGAHIGADSIELARIFPDSKVYAFEPVPEVYHSLQHNVRKYKNIFTYQLALSNRNGTSKMYISSGDSDASSSLNKPVDHLADHPGVEFNNELEVKTRSLDQWAKENNIQSIDFLWLDMQGHELEMLKASVIILPRVKVIHTEVSVRESYAGVTTYQAYKEWLIAAGFVLYKEAVPANYDMGNALFVRK